VLLLAGLLVLPGGASMASERGEARQAPAIRLLDLDGKPVLIDYAAAGLTLVNFWATWCGPCRAEMPQIEILARQYADRGFRAVGIAMDSGKPGTIRDFLEAGGFDLSYAMLVGDDAVSDGFGGIEIVPTTFLVSRKGRIVSRHLGAEAGFQEQVAAEIEKHLAGGAGGE